MAMEMLERNRKQDVKATPAIEPAQKKATARTKSKPAGEKSFEEQEEALKPKSGRPRKIIRYYLDIKEIRRTGKIGAEADFKVDYQDTSRDIVKTEVMTVKFRWKSTDDWDCAQNMWDAFKAKGYLEKAKVPEEVMSFQDGDGFKECLLAIRDEPRVKHV